MVRRRLPLPIPAWQSGKVMAYRMSASHHDLCHPVAARQTATDECRYKTGQLGASIQAPAVEDAGGFVDEPLPGESTTKQCTSAQRYTIGGDDGVPHRVLIAIGGKHRVDRANWRHNAAAVAAMRAQLTGYASHCGKTHVRRQTTPSRTAQRYHQEIAGYMAPEYGMTIASTLLVTRTFANRRQDFVDPCRSSKRV